MAKPVAPEVAAAQGEALAAGPEVVRVVQADRNRGKLCSTLQPAG